MAGNSWETIGREICETVEDAIRYGDFSNVSYHIGNMVNEAMDVWRGPSRQQSYQPPYQQKTYRQEQDAPSYAHTSMKSSSPALYKSDPFGVVLGLLFCIGGFFFAVMFFLCFCFLFIAFLFEGFFFEDVLVCVVLAACVAVCVYAGVRGARRFRLSSHYRSYLSVLRGRSTVPVSELAKAVHKRLPFVEKELQKLLNKRWFYEAHLDTDGHYFLLTDEAYQTYTQAQKQYNRRMEQSRAKQKEDDDLPEECRELIRQGRAYVAHIRSSNDKIPGEEMTAKLAHMERVVARIFDVVKEHPEVASDLNKMMNYYLPTTKKLLDTYAELDTQMVGGVNISTTKKEIEATIDTLNDAFEQLLDGLYETRAWDISSDISVLHTILAQDGLKQGMR